VNIEHSEERFFVGVDGCPAGWLMISVSTRNNWEAFIYHKISSLWNDYANAYQILIDIPIGLRERGREERRCDREARSLLRKRKSSIFRVPCRGAVHAETYDEANRVNKELTTKGIPPVTWGIVSKIKEIDVFLSENIEARAKIREVHPEICFWGLNGGCEMQYNKKKMEGFKERKLLLEDLFPLTGEIVDYAMSRYLRKEVARDDILDALAISVTGLICNGNYQSIPKDPEVDSKGLPMQIVYAGF